MSKPDLRSSSEAERLREQNQMLRSRLAAYEGTPAEAENGDEQREEIVSPEKLLIYCDRQMRMLRLLQEELEGMQRAARSLIAKKAK